MEKTQIGISVENLDRAKIHIVKYKNKYDSLTDFVDKATAKLIEADENDDSNTAQ